MHSFVTRINASRSARRMRQAERIHAAREDLRHRSAPLYAFGAPIRWAA
jgi:hypothetical protein